MWPKQDTRKESPSIESYRHGSKENAEREIEKSHGEAKPPNLLIIALFGFASFTCIFSLFSLHFRSCALTLNVYMQQSKKIQN